MKQESFLWVHLCSQDAQRRGASLGFCLAILVQSLERGKFKFSQLTNFGTSWWALLRHGFLGQVWAKLRGCWSEDGGAWPFYLDAWPEFRSMDSGASVQEPKWFPPGNAFLTHPRTGSPHTACWWRKRVRITEQRETWFCLSVSGCVSVTGREGESLPTQMVCTTEESKRAVAGWIFFPLLKFFFAPRILREKEE